MKKIKIFIIPFCILFLYLMAIIFVPIVASKPKKRQTYDIVETRKKLGDDVDDIINRNNFMLFVEYEEDKNELYKKYKKNGVKIYLSIYDCDDLNNYDSDIFTGIFIKNSELTQSVIKEFDGGKIWLLSNNIDDIKMFIDRVETFAFDSSLIVEASLKYDNLYMYQYVETDEENLYANTVNYLKNAKSSRVPYGLITFIY